GHRSGKMKRTGLRIGLVAVVASLALTACAGSSTAPAPKTVAANAENIEGSDLKRVTLSDKAAQRLGIQTVPVREELIGGVIRRVIPYAAVLYAAKGDAWAYTNPEALAFIRHALTIESIAGDVVVLSDGPPVGTLV